MRLTVPTLQHHAGSRGYPAHRNHREGETDKPLSTVDRSLSGQVKLGDLSMRYEPGQEYLAAAKVSSGRNDPGGISYGAYRLNSRKGDKVRDFLSYEGAPWFNRFRGLDETMPGSEFGEA